MSEKKLWSRNETLQLIEKFEQNRELWDPTLGRNSGYLKKIKKHTLVHLAAEFDTSDIEVGRKLHNLKTQFHQELKKVLQHSISGKEYNSKWQYYDMMKFLQPGNLNSSLETEDSMNSANSRIEAIKEELTSTTQSVKRNKKCTPQKIYNGNHDHPVSSKVPDKVEDEYKIFGDYVANEIRNMHFLRYKGLLKRKIQRLIIEFTEMDEEEYLKCENCSLENGTSETVYQSKPGPSQMKDESAISESMYLVINGVRHSLDNSPQRQEDPLGKV